VYDERQAIISLLTTPAVDIMTSSHLSPSSAAAAAAAADDDDDDDDADDGCDEVAVVESIVSGRLDRLPPAVPRSVCVFLSSTFSGNAQFTPTARRSCLCVITAVGVETSSGT